MADENSTDEENQEQKMDSEENESELCPSCGEPVPVNDIMCDNCGEVILGEESNMTEEDENKDDDDILDLENAVNEESGEEKQKQKPGPELTADSTPAGLSSLGGMIEEKVMTTVKQREERIRDSMKKTVRERERKIREKMQERIDNAREKHEEEKARFMEQLEKEREGKEQIRRELQDKIEELREKIDEKTSEIDKLKEKHVEEKNELREKHQDEIRELNRRIENLKDEHTEEKEELREKFQQEKEELRKNYEKEKEELRDKFELKKHEINEDYEREKEELQEEIENLRNKLEEKEIQAEKRRDELREKYEDEKSELKEAHKEEKKELRYNLEKEKVDLKNRLQDEIEDLQERLKEERESSKESSGIMGSFDQMQVGAVMGDGLAERMKKRLKEPVFPFPAIVGQERMKRALLLNAINPNINGVLIWGEEGCGKRTALVSLAELLSEIEDTENDDEEIKVWSDHERYITGTIHSNKTDTTLMVDKVLKNGSMNVKKLDSCEKKGTPIITVESLSPYDKYMLSYLDSFALQVKVEMIEDIDKRREIIRRKKEYDENPESFYEEYQEKCHDLRDRIVKTRQTLSAVTIGSRQRNTLSNLSAHASLPSGSDIMLEEISRTITAYDGREEVTDQDIQEAVDIMFVSKARDYLLEEM